MTGGVFIGFETKREENRSHLQDLRDYDKLSQFWNLFSLFKKNLLKGKVSSGELSDFSGYW